MSSPPLSWPSSPPLPSSSLPQRHYHDHPSQLKLNYFLNLATTTCWI
jgi:hypothetical protein